MTQPPAPAAPRRFRLSVVLAAWGLAIVVAALALEGAARLVYQYRETVRALPGLAGLARQALDLDPYEMPSPRAGYHWVLRPGYRATGDELAADKVRAGRDAGAQALAAEARAGDAAGAEEFRINLLGFKGAELDPAHARPRVLALGDSVTFGLGAHDYPTVLQATLTARGIAAEVINGGVEGYSARNALLELDRYVALKPDVVTLYLGWNSLYAGFPDAGAWENRLRVVWIANRVAQIVRGALGDAKERAAELYRRRGPPDPADPMLGRPDDRLSARIAELERLAEAFAAAGARVYLVTLPGLFAGTERPSERALSLGHLPHFTANPLVLAALTNRHNEAVRGLAARRQFGLIDLAAWSIEAFRPRDAYFLDSVHLTRRGLELVGVHMADRLADALKPRDGSAAADAVRR